MTPGRLETFADGVFAIAATLLILNVATRVGEHEVEPGEATVRDLAILRRLRRELRDDRQGPWIYLAATLVAFVSPTASVVLFGEVAVFHVVESSWFGRSRTKG